MHEFHGLIKEYRKSLKLLRSAKAVPLHYGSMVSDTQFAIEIMETGKIPGTKWTVARWSRDKREIPVDPLQMARYITYPEPVKSAPEWMIKLLDEVMGSLTKREKDAYQLVRGQLYSFSQAATLMGCNKGSVQNFVARAEKKIGLVVRQQTMVKGLFTDSGQRNTLRCPEWAFRERNMAADGAVSRYRAGRPR